ncbi:MAG: undecaprenyldiphospho-muramoylpentapeptide beta-N-acetylglucosaminyltransferase [Deltaproteobacteria bacterium]|nr:MAG: undecaprenyldiphospho-muramoylpentapeptide beta-N-acetylglucosaminyltransferase [Deltaproteobacteria bacterium]
MAERVVIAAGGTGGHIFPAQACADEFIRWGWRVSFVGVGRELERRVFPSRGDYHVVKARPLKGGGPRQKVLSLVAMLLAVKAALGLLRSLNPACVLGMGGYSSGPVILAAALLRVPRAIHEQNTVPGLANRLSAPFAQRIFVSFEETLKAFPASKTLLTGNPVREEVVQKAQRTGRGDTFTLFVMGGSQGARAINQAMAEALPHLRGSIEVIHQTGKDDPLWVQEAYRRHGVKATVFPFTEDVGSCYGRAHLVVSRAGALTLAELAVVGRASILIPYPFAADDHQRRNAEAFCRRGAALMIPQEDLTGEHLARRIKELMADEGLRRKMEERALQLGRPEAAREVVERSIELCEG